MFETLFNVYIYVSLLFYLRSNWASVLYSPLTHNVLFILLPLYSSSLLIIPVLDLKALFGILSPGTFIQELKMADAVEGRDLAMETLLGWPVLFPIIYFMWTFYQMLDAEDAAKEQDLIPLLLELEFYF